MSEGFVTAMLGLGGNVGDPVAAMASALRAIDAHSHCRVIDVSRLYRTPPWGKTDQDWFFNSAASIETSLSAEALLDLALEIERANHRIRIERWGPRTLDIDILDFGGRSIDNGRLTLPHPRIAERAFVLMPLADIAPDLVIEGRTVREWLKDLDKEGVEIVSDDGGWRQET